MIPSAGHDTSSVCTSPERIETNRPRTIKGQLFETGKKLNVTGFDELKEYIMHELGGVMPQETDNGNLEQ